MKFEEALSNKKRLDVEMFSRGLARSRSEARDLIARGKVSVNKKISTKASVKVSSEDRISIDSPSRFVSRSGEKLFHALEVFKIDPRGFVAVDIGSSTGGFTECLLNAGAQKVISVDVGTGQFSETLRNDSRIELHESTDVRAFSLPSPIDLVVTDVSFISLSLVLPKIFEFLKSGGQAIVLVKPQFEVGMEIAQKHKGVITDEKLQKECVVRVSKEAKVLGFRVVAETASPIEGEKGNKEFLLLLRK